MNGPVLQPHMQEDATDYVHDKEFFSVASSMVDSSWACRGRAKPYCPATRVSERGVTQQPKIIELDRMKATGS